MSGADAPLPAPAPGDRPYASRGGLKLRAALDAFHLNPTGWWCADLGCSTGGFTDCLLRAGAERVAAVDTAYGELAWTLRNDPRVIVMERTNALHASPPETFAQRGGADLVTLDLSWTRQELAVPAAARWVRPGGTIVTLIKPHYERAALLRDRAPDAGAADAGGRGGATTGRGGPRRGRRTAPAPVVLPHDEAEAITHEVVARLAGMGFTCTGLIESPILGGAVRGSGSSGVGRGNAEWLARLEASAGGGELQLGERTGNGG